MKYRATCPVCNARISRAGFFINKVECRSCGAMLRQNAKWDWIGSGVVMFFTLFLPVIIVIFWRQARGDLEQVLLGLSVMAVVLMLVGILVCFILFPYASKYEIDPKHDESKQKTCPSLWRRRADRSIEKKPNEKTC